MNYGKEVIEGQEKSVGLFLRNDLLNADFNWPTKIFSNEKLKKTKNKIKKYNFNKYLYSKWQSC